MKKILPLFTLLLATTLFAQTPCENGFANNYPCNGLDLQSFIGLNEMNAGSGNDSWGWTDPESGIEYALIGLDNGTAFIDISDPINPVYLGKLPTHTSSSTWRDIKVFKDHAFIVSEADGHGMQVFDLTRLRTVTNPPQNFNADAHYNGFGSAHNIAINEDTGYAYAIGTSTFSGGGHYIDINNPTNPVAAGGSSQGGYTHDAQIVIYNGPDTEHVGKELYFGSNEDQIIVIDVTNKANPQVISSVGYSETFYTHQGWLTEDQSLFIVNDELDEINVGFNTRTLIFDFSDLDNPTEKFIYSGPTASVDHNLYVKGDKMYLANYRAGLRIVDISDIENNNISETAYFDTYPEGNGASTSGAWNVYPFFASENLVISDINRGFFLVRDPLLGLQDSVQNDFEISPNPANSNVTIKATQHPVYAVEVFNILGQRVMNLNFSETTIKQINIEALNAGMYLLKINGDTTKRLIVK